MDASVEGDSLITQKPSPPLQRNTKKSNQPTPTTNQPPKTLRSFMRKRAKKRTAKSHHGLPFTTHSTFQGFEEIAQQRLHHEVVCLKSLLCFRQRYGGDVREDLSWFSVKET